MIARILKKPSGVFAGVRYNTNKMDRNTGELMRFANFGILQALSDPRPQDLINYLMMVSSLNKGIANTQFHAVLSATGRNYSKEELTKSAVLWLREMKYGEQPYLIVFHKDTENNHVHIISSRVGKNGKQIDRDYEKVRAVRNLNKVLGYDFALQYNFSTRAQFYLILENQGFLGRDYLNDKKLDGKIAAYQKDLVRVTELKALFGEHRSSPDFVRRLSERYAIDLVFHSSEGKKPYGYSVIDHATKQVFKGSEIWSLKSLLDENIAYDDHIRSVAYPVGIITDYDSGGYDPRMIDPEIRIRPIIISDDVDDQQVLGMKRRRQKKARTNTR